MALSSIDTLRAKLEVATLPAWEAGMAGSEIRYYSLLAKKSCHSNDDITDRIYGLLCIYPLSLLRSASERAKLPSAIASVQL